MNWDDDAFLSAVTWAIVLGIVVRWDLGISQACLAAGRKLAGIDDPVAPGTGLQDALTPPWRTNLSIGLWIAAPVGLAAGFYTFGALPGVFLAAAFVAAVGIAGLLIVPSPESSHYLGLIYRSLLRRRARFVESGDTLRASAVSELAEGMRSKYADKIG